MNFIKRVLDNLDEQDQSDSQQFKKSKTRITELYSFIIYRIISYEKCLTMLTFLLLIWKGYGGISKR